METIFALASGRGRAGVAVVRLSGPKSHAVVTALCGGLPKPRQASLRTLRWDGEVLDEALVLVFAHGASFTGEESAELQVHGGQAVLEAVFGALASFEGVRLAEPGEFTRRALENGCIELHEVEGLIDLIDAETVAQRRQAQRMMRGDLAVKAQEWRSALMAVTALIEATIDFSDEDVPADMWPEVAQRLARLVSSLIVELAGVRSAERIRGGFEVVVFGPPNVGKSSLVNALVGRDVAITSDIAGTTRDIIETRLDLDGLPVVLLDTAGLHESGDHVEREGMRRAQQRVEEADLRILVLDRDHAVWTSELSADLVVSSKSDLGWHTESALPVSVLTGAGLPELRAEIGNRLAKIASIAGVVVNERHRHGVASAANAMSAALEDIGRNTDSELIAARLQNARRFLEGLVGRIGVEDVLGEIFGRFCIGK
jgi:tRNA modification GTPase